MRYLRTEELVLWCVLAVLTCLAGSRYRSWQGERHARRTAFLLDCAQHEPVYRCEVLFSQVR